MMEIKFEVFEEKNIKNNIKFKCYLYKNQQQILIVSLKCFKLAFKNIFWRYGCLIGELGLHMASYLEHLHVLCVL
jgi:hypothetical protein